MKRLIFFVFAALALCSCSNGDEDSNNWEYDPPKHTSYLIPWYEFINKISVLPYKHNDGSSRYHIRFSKSYIHGWKKNHIEQHSYFSNLYGDTSYKGLTYRLSHPAFAYPFDKVTMSCDSDFDAKHPAGEPLDDIVMLSFGSWWEFIQNGYEYPEGCVLPQYPEDSDKNEKTIGEIMYNKYLSDINFDNSKLINSHRQPEVIFTTSPATPGEYTFTLELTTNGETFTTTFTQKFE